MSSDPNRFTITDYAYDRGADAENEVRAGSGYAEPEVRPYNGGQMYGLGYKQEAQSGIEGAGYGDDQITGSGSGPGVSPGPGSFSGPSGAPAASFGGNRDPTVLARPITSPISTQTSAPPTASSSRMGSLSSASGSSRTQLKPSISARTGGTGYVPKKGKDAFPIPESVQAQMQTSPDSAGPSAGMGSHQYPPTSPPGPVGPSSSFRRLPNVPGASSPPIALGGSNGSGSLAHSTSLSSQATQSTQAAAFPTANPLQGDYLSRGESGRNGTLHMGGYGGSDPRNAGQSAGFGPVSPPLAMPAPSPQPFLGQPDFCRSGGTGSPGLGSRSNSASNLLSPGHIDGNGNGIGLSAQSPAGGFHPVPSASLSDAGSSVSRPAYPSMPSTSTELPTLPSIGRSYRHSGVSAGTSSNWAEQGIEPAIHHRGGLNGNGYDDHHDDDDDDVKEKDVDGSTKQLASKEPAAERTWSWRKFVPGTTATRLLLFVVIFELVVDLTIEGNILYRFNVEVDTTDSTDIMNENKRRLPIYLIIFGLAHLWQLVLTVISIRTKNTIQVSAVTLFNFAFLAWAVIQVNELRDIVGSLNEQALILDGTKNKLVTLPLNILTGIIIGVVAAGCLALGVLTFFLRREFGMARYRFLGADTTIRRCYKHFQVFECVCYFSAFFCAGFGIQFVWLVLQRTDVEYIITIVALPVSILLLVFGRLAAKYENKPCMILFLFGNVCGVGYFGFKLVRIWQQAKTVYLTTSKSLTVFAALSVLTIVLLLVWGVIVFMGFGKGLKREICGKEFWRRYFRGNKGAAKRQGVGAGGIDGAQAEYAQGKRGGPGQRGMVQMNRLSID